MKFQIKEARELAGLSQKELAEKIGVAPNTFHGYESGKHDPKSNILADIANVCGVSVDFLLGLQKENAPAPSEDDTEALTVDEVVNAFVKAGIVPPGKDLSNEDLRFLEALIAAVDQWSSK